MNHDTLRERLALDLYGELDEAETAELEAHLESCGDCRALRAELARDLGALAEEERQSRAFEEALTLDPERVSAIAAEAPAGGLESGAEWSRIALAFAAGMLVTAGLQALRARGATELPPGFERLPDAALDSTFRRAEPPPPATRAGPAGMLAALRR